MGCACREGWEAGRGPRGERGGGCLGAVGVTSEFVSQCLLLLLPGAPLTVHLQPVRHRHFLAALHQLQRQKVLHMDTTFRTACGSMEASYRGSCQLRPSNFGSRHARPLEMV